MTIKGRRDSRSEDKIVTLASVPGSVIRVEDQSKDIWQNVELSLPYLREALAMRHGQRGCFVSAADGSFISALI